jgi:hypothetical protein
MAKMFKCDMCGKVLESRYGCELKFESYEVEIANIGFIEQFDVCLDCRDKICDFIEEYKKEGN